MAKYTGIYERTWADRGRRIGAREMERGMFDFRDRPMDFDHGVLAEELGATPMLDSLFAAPAREQTARSARKLRLMKASMYAAPWREGLDGIEAKDVGMLALGLGAAFVLARFFRRRG